MSDPVFEGRGMTAALDRLAAHRPEGQGLSILEVHGSVEVVERPSAGAARAA